MGTLYHSYRLPIVPDELTLRNPMLFSKGHVDRNLMKMAARLTMAK
jgi:hypothetical protein